MAGGGGCPFCEGHEDRTPREVYAVRPGGGEPNTPAWTSRVVPNLYPLLSNEAEEAVADASVDSGFSSPDDPLRSSTRAGPPDAFSESPAIGAHEVIVNAPEHVASLAELGAERFAAAIETWRERMRAHPDAAYC